MRRVFYAFVTAVPGVAVAYGLWLAKVSIVEALVLGFLVSWGLVGRDIDRRP